MHRLLLLAALLVLPTAGQAQTLAPWLTTDWSIWCPDPSRVAVPAMCDDESPVSGASFVRHQLEDASTWLRGLGFAGARVDIDGRRERPRPGVQYLAEIAGDTVRVGDVRVCGYYRRGRVAGGNLVLNAGHMIRMGTAPDQSATAAHELFHAVQGSYPYDTLPGDHGWIDEGTAQAVEAAYLHRTDGVPVLGAGGHAYVYGARDYSFPLWQPNPSDMLQEYATSHFWLALGEMIGATDRVGYLHDVLQQVDEANGGIVGVDAVLRAYEPTGLYRLFPRVIARYAADPQHYSTKSVYEVPAGTRSERTRQMEVQPDAASFVRVVLPPSNGAVLGVTITLTDAVNAHLVVGEEVYSETDLMEAGAERNVFRTQVQGPDTLDVRVVNVNLGGATRRAATFDLTVRVEPLDACTPGPMMATLHPAFEWAQGQLRGTALGGAALTDRGLIHDTATYQREFEVVETAPAPGEMRVSGLVSDGGVACGDPIGTSPMRAALTLGQIDRIEAAMTDPARQEAMVQRMMERMSARTPEEMAAMADSSFALAAQTGSMWDRDAQTGLAFGSEFMGDEITAIIGPHTAIKVFSPNAFGWQLDAVPGGPFFLQHGGVGGWQANAGLAVGVILPGTDVQTLRPGQSVPARLAANPDDADDEAAVVYARWTGAETRLPDGSYAFQGDDVAVRSRSLAGTFEVTDVTGAEVRGRLRLTGSAHRLTQHYRYTRDDDGRIDGDTIERDDEQTGPLTIDATVRLPAAVEVNRPGRFIERTARVGTRR